MSHTRHNTITGADWERALPVARSRRRQRLVLLVAAINKLQAARFAELQAANTQKLDNLEARAAARASQPREAAQ